MLQPWPVLSLSCLSMCVSLQEHGSPSWLCSVHTPSCNQLITLPCLHTCLSSTHHPVLHLPKLSFHSARLLSHCSSSYRFRSCPCVHRYFLKQCVLVFCKHINSVSGHWQLSLWKTLSSIKILNSDCSIISKCEFGVGVVILEYWTLYSDRMDVTLFGSIYSIYKDANEHW